MEPVLRLSQAAGQFKRMTDRYFKSVLPIGIMPANGEMTGSPGSFRQIAPGLRPISSQSKKVAGRQSAQGSSAVVNHGKYVMSSTAIARIASSGSDARATSSSSRLKR